MFLGVDAGVLVAIAVTLVVGAAVQGLVGLGLGLVSAPVVTLLDPALMPQLLIWLAATLPLLTLTRERADIDWRGLAWVLPARIPGTAVGVALLAVFSTRALGIGVGVMVLAAVLLTVRAVRLPVNRISLVVAGLVSGITGTATSIGGPPVALLLQHRPPRQVRTTLAVFFVAGASLSLAGFALAGELRLEVALLALVLSPCLVVGTLLAIRLRGRLHERALRPAVLAVCAASALVLLGRSLLG